MGDVLGVFSESVHLHSASCSACSQPGGRPVWASSVDSPQPSGCHMARDQKEETVKSGYWVKCWPHPSHQGDSSCQAMLSLQVLEPYFTCWGHGITQSHRDSSGFCTASHIYINSPFLELPSVIELACAIGYLYRPQWYRRQENPNRRWTEIRVEPKLSDDLGQHQGSPMWFLSS